MRVVVKLFAAARELAGRPEIKVDVSDDPTVAEVSKALQIALPKIEALVSHARWAVDNEFAKDSKIVTANSEIALIPPVSGG